MIRFFKSPQPAALIVIPAIVFILWIQSILNFHPVVDSLSMPLWRMIGGMAAAIPSWLNFLIMVSLVAWSAVYLNLVMNRHEVLYKNSFLPAFVYALFISSIPAFLTFHPVHFINLILIRIFDKAFALFKSENPVPSLFDSCFLTGVAALIYFPAVFIIPVMIVALMVLRPWNIREWIIMLIGIILPFFFLSVWYFWHDAMLSFWKNYMIMFTHLRPEINIIPGQALVVLASLFALWLLMGILKLRMNYLKNIIRTRSYQQIMFVLLILCAASFLLVRNIMLINFAILAIPLTVFCAYYLVSAKKRIRLYEIFLYGVIAVIIWNHL